MGISDIEWTYYTFNIVWGCEKVSPACKNCYAASTAAWRGFKNLWGPGSQRRVLSDAYWLEPLKWDAAAKKAGERRRVFCSSMADVFEDHPTVNEQRERLWKLIDATPNLDWLLLTKRPENFERFLPWYESGLSPKNVWLGVTAENQKYLDIRVPKLLLAAAAVHFISYEPALGPIDARFYLDCSGCHGEPMAAMQCPRCLNMPRLDLVICGFESGQSARPGHPDWARSIRDQVVAARKAFFFKQWGEWKPISEMSEAESNALYVSKKKADPKDPDQDQETFDEIYGRRCIVPVDSVGYDGVRGHWELREGHCAYQTFKVGKDASGRVLDGRTWDEMPREVGA
jgi:protein gp37